MAGNVRNGWKLQEIAGNSLKWPDMAGKGWKGLKISGNGCKWLDMAEDSGKS